MALAAVVCLGFAACVSAPVQEMSDARQAIAAARTAGAAERAPKEFKLATDMLAQAESALQRQDYPTARRRAEDARKHALAAMREVSPQ